jgi:xanthine dehydrogenase YagR molybdenum-binding subunit
MHLTGQAIGLPLDRIDGLKKVTGSATYAYEYPVEGTAYAFALQSAIAKGRVVSIDASAARELPGVLAVLSQENAPRLAPLADAELAVFQSDAIAYRGQFVAAVVAETFEIARQAASLIAVRYEEQPHDVELTASRRDLYKPERLLGGFEADTSCGDVETALARASVSLDHTYTTPPFHANPLEPHATLAVWGEDGVTLYDANQGPAETQDDVARAFGLPPERVRVIAPYVGGGFGSKGFTHAHVIVAVMAAQVVRRPVKLALTRQQMFALVGYRTPTIQRIRLGADSTGQLAAISHDVIEQTSSIQEFAE